MSDKQIKNEAHLFKICAASACNSTENMLASNKKLDLALAIAWTNDAINHANILLEQLNEIKKKQDEKL